MASDPQGLVTFEAGGVKYTAVFGFRAMKAVEAHYDLPFFQALQQAMPGLSPEDAGDPAKLAAAGAGVSLTGIGKLFECALLKHHPDLTEGAIEELVDELGFERVGALLGEAVAAALVKEGDGKSAANPPSRARKTG
jgi:hypothetical protein